MPIVTRNEKGKLYFSNLDYAVFIGEILGMAKTREEIEFISEQMIDQLELEVDELLEDFSE